MAQHPHGDSEHDAIDVERQSEPQPRGQSHDTLDIERREAEEAHTRPPGYGFETEAEVSPHPHHTISVATYWKVFGWLMVFLVLTLVAALPVFDFGWVSTLIALTIAGIKMFIVVLFFMHLKYSSFLIRGIAVGAFIWLSILFVFTLSDYLARDWVSTRVDPIRQEPAPVIIPDR